METNGLDNLTWALGSYRDQQLSNLDRNLINYPSYRFINNILLSNPALLIEGLDPNSNTPCSQ